MHSAFKKILSASRGHSCTCFNTHVLSVSPLTGLHYWALTWICYGCLCSWYLVLSAVSTHKLFSMWNKRSYSFVCLWWILMEKWHPIWEWNTFGWINQSPLYRQLYLAFISQQIPKKFGKTVSPLKQSLPHFCLFLFHHAAPFIVPPFLPFKENSLGNS